MAVNPDSLFIYWEVLDESINAARQTLGAPGANAALSLRIHDTSGRIFDGTNAHSYWDQPVRRTDRQWFCDVNKPASTAHVDIGLLTEDGYFHCVARSGRVDFPRRDSAPGQMTEWMHVAPNTGEVVGDNNDPPSGGSSNGAGSTPDSRSAMTSEAKANTQELGAQCDSRENLASILMGSVLKGPVVAGSFLETSTFEGSVVEPEHFEHYLTDVQWVSETLSAAEIQSTLEASSDLIDWRQFGWTGLGSSSSWEAGPFLNPVEVLPPSLERHEGPPRIMRVGKELRVLHGPWQVVIRGLGARSGHQVVSRWEVHRTWSTETARKAPAYPSHRRLGGASELHALAASELRLQGASEVFFLGASERRFIGASELRFIGASELRFAGASERRFMGASELRFAGASERHFAGASERYFAGASERRFAGASDNHFAGASDRHSGPANKRRFAGGEK
jgi:hypothetical protein